MLRYYVYRYPDGTIYGYTATDYGLGAPAQEVSGEEYTELTGQAVSIEPEITERPPEPEPSPTEAEQLRADVDFLAAMQGVAL